MPKASDTAQTHNRPSGWTALRSAYPILGQRFAAEQRAEFLPASYVPDSQLPFSEWPPASRSRSRLK